MSLTKEQEEKVKSVEIKNERDYFIRRGRIMERFTEEFWNRHKHNSLYLQVVESLIRDADPYEVIEKLFAINDEQYEKILELIQLMPPQIQKPQP